MFRFVFKRLGIDGRYWDQAGSNFIWLVLDRVVRLGLAFLSGVLLARFLGTTDFGTFSYLMAFFSIFAAIGSLGTNGIAVKLMARNTRFKDKVILSVFVLNFAGYAASGILMFIAINLFGKSDEDFLILSAILSTALLLKSSDALKFWFEARLQSRFVVLPEVLAVVVIFIGKLLLIHFDAPLVLFIVAFLFELLIAAIGVFLLFIREQQNHFRWKYSKITTHLVFRRSWPIAVSIVSTVAYMKIDQIMIGGMIGLEEAGIYSAAVIISESIYFLPIIINQTLRPIFFKERLASYQNFIDYLQSVYIMMTVLAMCYSIFVTFFADEIIAVTYGSEYAAAAGVLMIHAWAAVFVFFNNTTWVWHIAENQQGLASVKVILGLILNVALNLVLIPRFGILGAAVATLVSRMFAAYVVNAFFKETRQLFFMMSYALVFKKKGGLC